MFSKKYRLSYLPLFYEDLDEKVTYIAEKLKNPKAANDLLDKVESAIMERLPVAESLEPYHSVRERRYPYYRIYVDNYIIYYVVIDDDPNDLIMIMGRIEIVWCNNNLVKKIIGEKGLFCVFFRYGTRLFIEGAIIEAAFIVIVPTPFLKDDMMELWESL